MDATPYAQNDRAFVRDAITTLNAAGLPTWLFGGWVEALRPLTATAPAIKARRSAVLDD